MAFRSYRREVLSAVEAAQVRALEICGGIAEGYAKARCPVDTGNLRNSITHENEDPTTEVIGSNVYYAPFVELGTRKMQPRPFLVPAVEGHMNEYKQIIDAELKKL